MNETYVSVSIKIPVELYDDLLAYARAKGFSGRGKQPLENLYSKAAQEYRNSKGLTGSERAAYEQLRKADDIGN